LLLIGSSHTSFLKHPTINQKSLIRLLFPQPL
jgi:hypothetical protein